VTQRVPLDSTYLFERGADGRYVGPPGVPAPAARAAEVPLSPYDAVLILRQPDWELQRTVFVGGEVRFPGRYALVKKSERLTELLARAGGLTSEAYADGVEFVRTRDRVGRIGVDLPRAQRDPASRDNLILAAGDSIVVPAYSPVVTVAGAVNSPTAVPWVPGASADYYVRAAGGERSDADHGRIFVRQPNGKVESVRRRPLFLDAVPEPRAGSVVTVATRDPRQPRDWVPLAGLAAQILGAIVTIVVVSRNTR
jgi:protein involved in polysaccharide export with SLBB domain